MAEESGDGDKVKVIQDELNELEERAEALDRQRTKNISAIRCGNDCIQPASQNSPRMTRMLQKLRRVNIKLSTKHVGTKTKVLNFYFPPFSYINQRNRSWNIVESEKALVVSLHSL